MANISPTKNTFFTPSAPLNYQKVDDFVSRSAQPNENNLIWLKENGNTDVINFRTMFVPSIEFDEPKFVTNLGMNYHNFPITEKFLNTANDNDLFKMIFCIFDTVKNAKASGGRVHWHCKAGADRTGFVSLIYKTVNNIDTFEHNTQEMLNMGHNQKIYPNIIKNAERICKML